MRPGCVPWSDPVFLESSSATDHPGVGDVAVGGIPGSKCVELVGEDEVALVAEYDGVRYGERQIATKASWVASSARLAGLGEPEKARAGRAFLKR